MKKIVLYDVGPIIEGIRVKDTQVILVTQQATFDSQKWDKDTIVFILLELTWGVYKPTDFHGLTLLKQLRLEKRLTCPIVLFSFFSKKYLLNYSGKEFQILKTPGHYFYQLPIDFNSILYANYEGIDELLLTDINDHVFDLAGIIEEIFHQLKNQVLSIINDKTDEIFSVLRTTINKAFLEVRLRIPELLVTELQQINEDLLAQIEQDIINQKPLSTILSLLTTKVEVIKQLLPIKEQIIEFSESTKTNNWQVLFVEDNSIIAQQIQDSFQQMGITCHLARTAKATYTILAKDTLNEITALICDYRLLSFNGDWQTEQGYHILKTIFTSYPNFLAFFALTSFNRKALLKVSEQYNMKMTSFSKEDVMRTNADFFAFAKTVTTEAEAIFNVVTSIPKSKVWKDGYPKKFDQPYSYYYRLHRLAEDFYEANIKVEKNAEQFVNEVTKLRTDSNYIMQLPYAVGVNTFQESIGKDKQENSTADKLQKFRFKLMGRRIAIALYNRKELKKNQIYNVLKDGFLGRPTETNNTINQFFTTYLGLSLEKDIPNRLLPEERYWLEHLQITQ